MAGKRRRRRKNGNKKVKKRQKKNDDEEEERKIFVTRVTIYPIKSCGGTELTECKLVKEGLEGDRIFMVVDKKSGRFVTQRNCPRMALIRPQLLRSRGSVSGVRLMALNETSILDCPIVKGLTRRVSVWDDTVTSYDQGDEAANWLSTFLNRDVRLVYVGDERRAVGDAEKFAIAPGKDSVAFSDGYPILLASEESLEDLNSRLKEAIPMKRFRPNVVVRGAGAFSEDRWKEFQINDIKMYGVKRCCRCKIPTTNQLTAERSKEPTKTLETYRRGKVKTSGVFFGQNVIHEQRNWFSETFLSARTISIGDPVRVLNEGEIPETSKSKKN